MRGHQSLVWAVLPLISPRCLTRGYCTLAFPLHQYSELQSEVFAAACSRDSPGLASQPRDQRWRPI